MCSFSFVADCAIANVLITIDRIQIVNGAASAIYGSNTVGAVINLITKKPVHRFEAGMKTSYQTNNTNRLQRNIGGIHDKTTLAGNIFQNTTDGYNIAKGASSLSIITKKHHNTNPLFLKALFTKKSRNSDPDSYLRDFEYSLEVLTIEKTKKNEKTFR